MGDFSNLFPRILLCFLCLCTVSSFSKLSQLSYSNTIETKTVDEGGNLTLVCNVTASSIYWTHDGRVVVFNKTLVLINITRTASGIYTCYDSNMTFEESREKTDIQGDIYSMFLNVLYPAKILHVSVPSKQLHEQDDWNLQVQVEGNPRPTTTFQSLDGGTIWFLQTSEGSFNITIPSVNCTDTGQYELTCDNDLANTSVAENLTVLCPPVPDPRYEFNNTVKPRVGETVEIIVHVIGYPRPSYQWWHDGTQLFNHTDTTNSTALTLHDIAVNDFGQYTLEMRNEGGNSSTRIDIVADGPPDPVTDLKVSGVTLSTANISFVTGYDYNDTQTFFIMKDQGGNVTDFQRSVKDSPDDKGGRHVNLVITNLTESTAFSLTVLSGNSRANSTHIPEAVTFETDGKPEPDPRFPLTTNLKPRLGDTVNLVIHTRGNPLPEYHWSRQGKAINSTDDVYNSTAVLSDINVDSFGMYTLDITNKYGTNRVDYELIADGVPEAVSNLSVADVNETCAHLSFATGYDYNSSQTFIIERSENGKLKELKNCTDLTDGRGGERFTCILCRLFEDTIYNVTVISKNSRGYSPPVASLVQFTTYGKPSPDPGHTVNSTFKPRLGEDITLRMRSIGYPVPQYQWLHNGKPLKSSDSGYTSEVHIDKIRVQDFGQYLLHMTNADGNFTQVYKIQADGPPDPARELNCTDTTTDTVVLSWLAGFDYGSVQSFEVKGSVNNKDYTYKDTLPDSTKGKGGMESYTLNNLESASVYNLYLVAKNGKGNAPMSNRISFTTKDRPGKSHIAEYIGYAAGGVGAVVLIIIVIAVTRKCARKADQSLLDSVHENEEEADAFQRQPHHYRYDDAAAPTNL